MNDEVGYDKVGEKGCQKRGKRRLWLILNLFWFTLISFKNSFVPFEVAFIFT